MTDMDEMRMDLRDILSEMADADKPDVPRPCHEAQIDEIRRLYDAYQNGCPFGLGDLVTPRAMVPVRGAGEPHIVVEIVDGASCDMTIGNHGSNGFGPRLDMRVVGLSPDGEVYMAFWAESWCFEPYRSAE